MRVKIIDRSGWGATSFGPEIIDVEISDFCPKCGSQRGQPRYKTFFEDGAPIVCSVWENPCGHVDLYQHCIEEASKMSKEI